MRQKFWIKWDLLERVMRDKTITNAEKMVMFELINCYNLKTGKCYPSVSYLEKNTHLNRRTIRRSIQQLNKKNIVKTEIRHGKQHHGIDFDWMGTEKSTGEGLQTPPGGVHRPPPSKTSNKQVIETSKEDTDPKVVNILSAFKKNTNLAYRSVVDGQKRRKGQDRSYLMKEMRANSRDHQYEVWERLLLYGDAVEQQQAMEFARKHLGIKW